VWLQSSLVLVPFLVLQLWGTVAPATGNAAEVLTAQILHPPPGFKLREQGEVEIRIRVDGPSGDLSWELSLLGSGDEPATTLRVGGGPVENEVVAAAAWTALAKGEEYKLSLIATSGEESVGAESAIRVVDASYTLIPLEEGNLSRSAFAIYTVDAAGQLVVFSGQVADPTQLILFDRRNGRRESIAVRTGTTESVRLTPDGSRLFFVGPFPDSGGGSNFGLGFTDLSERVPVFLSEGGGSTRPMPRVKGWRTTGLPVAVYSTFCTIRGAMKPFS
jgi:hypothetical protein